MAEAVKHLTLLDEDELCRMLVLRRRGTKTRLKQDLHLFTRQRSIDELSDGSTGIDRRK